MDRDLLDLSEKTLVDPGVPGGGGVPFPGNINTMDPYGLDSLWHSVSDAIGLDATRMRKGRWGSSDMVGLALALQCADVIARDFTKGEMALWLEGAADEYTKVRGGPDGHWLASLLARKPNRFMTWKQFWRTAIIQLKLAQNAFIVKMMRRDGTVEELVPISPMRVTPMVSDGGNLFYEIAMVTRFERAQMGADVNDNLPIRVPANRVIHLKGRTWDGLNGISNTELGAGLFSLISAVNDYQTNVFGNNGTLLVAFETDQAFTGDMGDAAFQRLKRDLTNRMAKGEPFLLEAGLKAKVLSTNAREAMTEEAFKALVARICGLMQCPPHKIYAYDGVKYDNLATENYEYAQSCLIPLAEEIEESFRFGLLRDSELDRYWPEFNRQALLASDMKTLGELLDRFVKNGTMTINEVRNLLPLSLNPAPHGDRFTVPVNTALIDWETGEVVAQVAQGQNPGAGQEPGEPNPQEQQDRSLRLVK